MAVGEITYGDTTLGEEDTALLQEGQWLNDLLIQFYFEYLGKTARDRKERDFFFPPSSSFMLLFLDAGGAKELLNAEILSDLRGSDRVFVAVNDNEDHTATGGSHWSLLVFIRHESMFVHLDSCGSMNDRVARSYARNVAPLVGASPYHFVPGRCPQQANSADCGVFALAFAERIHGRSFAGPKSMMDSLSSVDQSCATALRYRLRDLIQSLA
mmetsp:Transcript_16637/g.46977  ORF Transcript_16637/g.46977 Transcript_16637/m.46977 type:complete len:213 (+) Transcript_16637:101-739(+)|eukprot:CAMPEP_0119124724 /NCGR_PEP_ID=MMETSP1310-20130426/4264_1 /TAXON_ID=464262 /ORGANISM="Genus nov. species nov., Strain RCC2339" /LENGTH=212 /DNA_ID=CAMNT_0007114719 /DNA_START=38 /DNA_END=676 /DNA_ORIENTATION=-